jgi:hypothetical protein
METSFDMTIFVTRLREDTSDSGILRYGTYLGWPTEDRDRIMGFAVVAGRAAKAVEGRRRPMGLRQVEKLDEGGTHRKR